MATTARRPRRAHGDMRSSQPGARTVRPTLSYGQALTQFRHSVQSMFEVMVGTNRPVSQPGKKPSPFGFTTSAAGTKPAFEIGRGSAKPWGGWGCGAV